MKITVLLRNSFIAIFGTFFVGVAVYAATTIGSNISTGGTLDVTGVSTFSRATSTSATSTAYLYVGFDVTVPPGWDFDGGDLITSGDAFFNSKATSSAAFWVGSGGTSNWLDLAGGDLYVQNDAEFDGTFYFGQATGTSATTTDYFYLGADITEPSGWDFSGGDLLVVGDAYLNNQATSSASFWVGSGGTADFINLSGGDLYVQDAAEIDGALNIGGNATSTGDFVVGTESTTATTSLQIKSDASGLNGASCIEWVNIENVTYREYVNTAGTKVLEAGTCK